MFGFTDIGHAFAAVAHDVVKVAKAAAGVLQKVQGQEQTVEAITSLIDPHAVEIERAAFNILGKACSAAESMGDAVAANGLVISLDAQAISDLKTLAAVLRARGAAVSPTPATAS